jgi:hypothetical protein
MAAKNLDPAKPVYPAFASVPVDLLKYPTGEVQANSVRERVLDPTDGDPASSKLSDQNCVCALLHKLTSSNAKSESRFFVLIIDWCCLT